MEIKKTNLSFKSLVKRGSTKNIYIHHSASTTGDAKTFHKWHLSKGWSGIGYHFVILKNGTIEEGRPIDSVGAHAQGYNSNSIGICLVGSFDKEKPTDKQIKSLVELLEYLLDKYGLNVSCVRPHSSVNSTICPCFDIRIATDKIKVVEDKLTLPKGVLCYGSKGKEVVNLQKCLNKAMGCSLEDDGILGVQTRTQLCAFQNKFMGAHEMDGVYGARTKEALKKVLNI